MKKIYNIILIGLVFILTTVTGLLYSASYNISIPDAHATIITNRVIILNALNGTSLTVLSAIDRYGVNVITNETSFLDVRRKERQRKERLLINNYYNANNTVKNNVDSALGISD